MSEERVTTVRAKFEVNAITEKKSWGYRRSNVFDVQMSAVVDGSEENKAFFEATPGGQITLTCATQAAVGAFRPGDEFYVDFTRVPKTAG